MKNVNFPDDCRLIHYTEQEDSLQKEDLSCLKADKRNGQRIWFLKIPLISLFTFSALLLVFTASHCVSIDVFVS